MLFQEGKNPSEIGKLIGSVETKTVVEIVNRLFEKINRVLLKVVDKTKIRLLKVRDFKLF